ncbi:MAG: 3-hydroxyacyl-ACP dehydratase FabZ [Deltaproteobacteria bacterium]|jgi:3-hydroxyacyl-[acyl-carrier-protein] dehydratase|nr:3-hydroxyacyl-ACP dehydratase FabZ [Deltaproteobacteria bacterium]
MPSTLYTATDILTYLPHRYPFVMVDGVTSLDPWKSIGSFKNLTLNEEFFQGHFPGQPVMPGVLILEAMAQTASLLVSISHRNFPEACPEGIPVEVFNDALAFFASCDKVKFRRRVCPGERLDMSVTALHQGTRGWKVQAFAEVEGKRAAQAEITATFINTKSLAGQAKA